MEGLAIRTPLIKFNSPDVSGGIYLKLENLQPIGAFKIRSLGNALKTLNRHTLGAGVYTASSGNSGYALAWLAAQMGIPARVYAPDDAPEGKCQAMRSAGAQVIPLPYEDWWSIICEEGLKKDPGLFINAVGNKAALSGNATIGMEILEDLPETDIIVAPYGGGGVCCGVASAITALKSSARVFAAESEMATPFTSAKRAGMPVRVEHQPSFISGIGSVSVLPGMWPLASKLLAGSVVSSLKEVCAAVRQLFEHNRLVAEGAAATALAGALTLAREHAAEGPIVCVITGGNIDKRHMIDILSGRIPQVI